VPIFPELGNLLVRSPGNVLVYGFLPVLPMCLGSALLMFIVSLLTPPPSAATIEKFFPSGQRTAADASREAETVGQSPHLRTE
jgi:ABC-type transport system involved in multi-copper enzyme maturation permease subunit